MQDFWRRWHISLSTFFRDYVYIPLGGSRVSKGRRDRNLLVTFTVSGLWHGANWTFIVWGAYHGALLVIQNRMPKISLPLLPPIIMRFIGGCLTFFLVCVGWVVFRSESMSGAWAYLTDAVTKFAIPDSNRSGVYFVLLALALDVLWRRDTRLETVDFLGLRARRALLLRWCSYVAMFWVVVVATANRSGIQQFIYFQF
jgi:D-alanyl-lipoteichoic acid acyltransferase DltB (MBOAT superfamily)